MAQLLYITKNGDQKIAYSTAGEYVVFLDNVSGRFDFEIEVPGIDLRIFGAYKGEKRDSFNLVTTQHHKSPTSTSNLLIKGVFEDESQFEYHGLIRIEKNCNGSCAYQKNQNLVLSDRVHIKSEPNLEILSNDVFCTHGSATGGPNREQMYYMETRGLECAEASNLLREGFLDEVYQCIDVLETTDRVTKLSF